MPRATAPRPSTGRGRILAFAAAAALIAATAGADNAGPPPAAATTGQAADARTAATTAQAVYAPAAATTGEAAYAPAADRTGLPANTAPRGSSRAPVPREAFFPTGHLPIPDDTVLMEQLEDAIDLRRREDFDRMLDARDPGELVEHATLNEHHFDSGALGIDTLFIVGDELFGYLFRPENGWGAGSRRERLFGEFMPKLRRVHAEKSGGPDAFACVSCHFKGGPDGAGTQTQNTFLRGDGKRIGKADQRNAPHLLGLGPLTLVAREMSAELRTQADAAAAEAKKQGSRVEKPLQAKGVSFGTIAAGPDGVLDTAAIEGVDGDLVVKPFGWKGHQAKLRDMIEEELHIHQGLITKRVQLGVREKTIDPTPYGQGDWDDLDEDGVSLEIDAAQLTTVAGYLAQLEAPVIRPPRDARLLDKFAAGRTHFDAIGCAGCHVPTLELLDPMFDAREHTDPDRPTFTINVAKDGEEPKIEPRYGGANTTYLVHLFSDLKRHDMGEALASPSPHGAIPERHFLTRPLWGLAETAPFLHDGRAPTLHDAIAMHGGDAASSRDAYLALSEEDRASVRVMLTSLSRQPKLFVP